VAVPTTLIPKDLKPADKEDVTKESSSMTTIFAMITLKSSSKGRVIAHQR
jgi:hypothetical protein